MRVGGCFSFVRKNDGLHAFVWRTYTGAIGGVSCTFNGAVVTPDPGNSDVKRLRVCICLFHFK